MNLHHHLRGFGIILFLSIMLTIPLGSVHSASAWSAQNQAANEVSVSVNMTSVDIIEGEFFTFSTDISNNGTEVTPSLVAHLNVASLVEGVYVDPEDWSSQRTVFLDPIGPGASVNLSWRVHALFAGDIAVYVVVLPLNSSSTPVVSKEVIVHVEKWSVLRLSNVTLVIIFVPVVLGTLYVGQMGGIALRGRRNKGRQGPR